MIGLSVNSGSRRGNRCSLSFITDVVGDAGEAMKVDVEEWVGELVFVGEGGNGMDRRALQMDIMSLFQVKYLINLLCRQAPIESNYTHLFVNTFASFNRSSASSAHNTIHSSSLKNAAF